MKEDKLLHKDLSYILRGMLFTIHNHLGQYCNEKQYGDALEYGLKKKEIVFKREYVLPPSFEGERVGRNRVDFLIEDVIVIELKAVRQLTKDHYFQCQRYLTALHKDLALLVNFRPKFLHIQRILNHQDLKRERK